ncbi:response regulator transcription factor [Micromonospora carbonacea subsp. aurantiaca]|uniref:Response regulator transcription factor n=1 Tax=Micromonospora carbonacea TaxID=47853 RepID=A0A1C4VEZ3_9ACTN|nr:response regulator transcription factor [Micromonospora carbonacea]SCE82578.1 two component transcriptional regulator, LuxR family [Micromonospora carbonacea]
MVGVGSSTDLAHTRRRDPEEVASGARPRVVTVVLADAQPVVRRGLHALLSVSTEIDVVAEAGSAQAALRSAASVRPDVLVLDIAMPDFQAGTLQEINRASPSTAVLVFTAVEDEAAVVATMRAGARGYVLKSCPGDGIVRTVRGLATGEVILGPRVADLLIGQLDREPRNQQMFPELTERERQVLELIAAGMRNAAIAARLNLSPKTISNHISTIFNKLNVSDRYEAIEMARKARFDRPRPYRPAFDLVAGGGNPRLPGAGAVPLRRAGGPAALASLRSVEG